MSFWSLFSRCLLAVVLCTVYAPAIAQTPSPLQEWQYSSGIILESMFEPNLPDWRSVVGVVAVNRPLYDGAELSRTQAGPVVNVQYKDLAFASVGDGIGINVLHGEHYRLGIALAYDLGRHVSDDVAHLQGLGDIGRAPVVKVFGSYVISKAFPLVLRADVRQLIGGAEGAQADLEAYLPLPGSSKQFVMFAGPSVTWSDHRYLQKTFGITESQALSSAYPQFNVHSGANAVGAGFSSTYFLSTSWLLNGDVAIDKLLGSARNSPLTQRSVQHVVTLSIGYRW